MSSEEKRKVLTLTASSKRTRVTPPKSIPKVEVDEKEVPDSVRASLRKSPRTLTKKEKEVDNQVLDEKIAAIESNGFVVNNKIAVDGEVVMLNATTPHGDDIVINTAGAGMVETPDSISASVQEPGSVQLTNSMLGPIQEWCSNNQCDMAFVCANGVCIVPGGIRTRTGGGKKPQAKGRGSQSSTGKPRKGGAEGDGAAVAPLVVNEEEGAVRAVVYKDDIEVAPQVGSEIPVPVLNIDDVVTDPENAILQAEAVIPVATQKVLEAKQEQLETAEDMLTDTFNQVSLDVVSRIGEGIRLLNGEIAKLEGALKVYEEQIKINERRKEYTRLIEENDRMLKRQMTLNRSPLPIARDYAAEREILLKQMQQELQAAATMVTAEEEEELQQKIETARSELVSKRRLYNRWFSVISEFAKLAEASTGIIEALKTLSAEAEEIKAEELATIAPIEHVIEYPQAVVQQVVVEQAGEVERVPTIIVGPPEQAQVSTSIIQQGVPLSPAQLVVTDAVDQPLSVPQAIQEHVRIGGGSKSQTQLGRGSPKTKVSSAAKGKATETKKTPPASPVKGKGTVRSGGYYDQYGRWVPVSPTGALAGAAIGGLVAGPPGLLAGAAIGGLGTPVAQQLDQPRQIYYTPEGQPYYLVPSQA